MTGTPGPYFHGSRRKGLTFLLSQDDSGVKPNHGGGGGWGIYFTQNQLRADLFAGKGGVTYEVRLHTRCPLQVQGYVGSVSSDLLRRCAALGVDCLLTDFMGETIILDPACIEIVAEHKRQIDAIWDDVRALESEATA